MDNYFEYMCPSGLSTVIWFACQKYDMGSIIDMWEALDAPSWTLLTVCSILHHQ